MTNEEKRTVERLMKMVQVLRNLPKTRKFDLESFAVAPNKLSLIEGACGTSACACGYAAMDPWFKKRGYTIRLDKNNYDEDENGKIIFDFDVVFKNHTGIEATDEFFGLRGIEFFVLFNEGYYKNPNKSNVIRRIEQFIKIVGNEEKRNAFVNKYYYVSC